MTREDWGTWDDDRRRKLTLGADSTPDERIAWLEEMAQIAWDAGALPKPRDRGDGSSTTSPRRAEA